MPSVKLGPRLRPFLTPWQIDARGSGSGERGMPNVQATAKLSVGRRVPTQLVPSEAHFQGTRVIPELVIPLLGLYTLKELRAEAQVR